MQKRNIQSDETGTAVVLVLVLMVVLLGFTALVTDAGLMYLNKAKMNNALDSAVLAGAQDLPDQRDQAIATAKSYAAANGVPANEITVTVNESHKTITATAHRHLGLFFAKVLGFDVAEINTRSKAEVRAISSATGVVPFGILEQEMHFGQLMILKEGGGSGDTGWFNALSLGGNGSKTYLDNIKYGYSEGIRIHQIIPTESGNMSGPTKTGIEYRNSLCHHTPRCSNLQFVEDCPRLLIIPVIRVTDTQNGNPSSVEVLGFAAFLVEGYIGSGTENEVLGTFVKYVVPGETSDSAGDYGYYGARLIE